MGSIDSSRRRRAGPPFVRNPVRYLRLSSQPQILPRPASHAAPTEEASEVVIPARLAAAVLGLIVVAGTLLAAHWSLSVDQWRVMTDELGYVKVGVSIAHSLLPVPDVRGTSIHNYGVLYPTLLAPLLGVLDMPTAFRIAHGLGALLMASAAVPAYLITLYVSRSRAVALAAAAPVALVPWLTFSMSLATEVAAYPVFLWVVLASLVAVAEPSPRRDLLALGAIALAFFTRTQFVFLLGLLPAAIVLHEVGMRMAEGTPRRWARTIPDGLRAAVTRHKLLAVALVAGAAIWLVGTRAHMISLGAYQGAVSGGQVFPPGFVSTAFDHLNEVVLGVAVLPLVLALAYVAERLFAPGDRRSHAWAVLIALTVPAVLVVATSFDLQYGGKIPQERYLFYVAPVLVVAAACYLQRARKPLLAVPVATVMVAAVVLQTSYPARGNFPLFASPARVLWTPLTLRAGQIGDALGFAVTGAQATVGALVIAAVVVIGLLRARRSRLAVAGFGGGMAVWCVAATFNVAPKVKYDHEHLARQGIGASTPLASRDWVDQALPHGALASLVPSVINARRGKPVPLGTTTDQGVWWEAEFWNKSVRRVYLNEGARDYTSYAREAIRVSPRSGDLEVSRPGSPYLVLARANVRFAPEGKVVASRRDLVLYRAGGPTGRPGRPRW